MPFEIAALLAALCWAIGGLIAQKPVLILGSMAFTRIRMTVVCALLAATASVLGGWESIPQSELLIILGSGFIGIFIGDTALFSTLGRLGPRRTSILFACNAPITAILSYWFFDEALSLLDISGCLLVMLGVFISIKYGKRKDQIHHWETIRGSALVGISLGLLAALGQSVGSIMIKPILEQGADPVAISALRCGIAVVGMFLVSICFPLKRFKSHASLNKILFVQIVVSGLFGMALGMTLLLYAYAHGDAGVAAILSSTTPVMLIPIIWFISKEQPAKGAWIGAISSVLGTALILLN